jgi:RNA polymerase sigma factor (TIGR02999 family)
VVNEAFIRFTGMRVEFQNRQHFFSVASRTMRRVLVDHAKGKARLKRPPPALREPLENVDLPTTESGISGWDIRAIDRVLVELKDKLPRVAEIMDLRYFGELSNAEIATITGLSVSTITRDVELGYAFLKSRLAPEGDAEN